MHLIYHKEEQAKEAIQMTMPDTEKKPSALANRYPFLYTGFNPCFCQLGQNRRRFGNLAFHFYQ